MRTLLQFLLLTLIIANAAYGETKKFLIGFPQDNMGNDWRKAQVMEVQKELSKYPNIDFIYSDAKGKTSKLVLDIESMIDEEIDLLIISPKDKKALTPVIDRIYKSNIPVVLLTRTIASKNYSTYIGPSDYNIAKKAAHTLAKKRGGKAKILMLEGVPTASTAIARKNGFLDGIKNYKNMKIVASKAANYQRSQAIVAVEEALKKGIKFDSIFAHSDSMASGAREALRKHGQDPKKYDIVGIDYTKEAKEAIKKGLQFVSYTYPTGGKEGAQAAVTILRGKRVPKRIEIPSAQVTKSNVDRVPTIF